MASRRLQGSCRCGHYWIPCTVLSVLLIPPLGFGDAHIPWTLENWTVPRGHCLGKLCLAAVAFLDESLLSPEGQLPASQDYVNSLPTPALQSWDPPVLQLTFTMTFGIRSSGSETPFSSGLQRVLGQRDIYSISSMSATSPFDFRLMMCNCTISLMTPSPIG